MPKHIVKCRICHMQFDTCELQEGVEWTMPQPRWYYHAKCYEDFAKKRGAIKEGDLSVEIDDEFWKGALFDYLNKDLKMSVNYVKFSNQWDTFLKKSMTAKGMYFTIRYFYEIAHGDTRKSENGIGIIPYIYEEGTSYWGERNIRDKGICDRIEAQIKQLATQKTKIILQKERRNKRTKVDLAAVADMEEFE